MRTLLARRVSGLFNNAFVSVGMILFLIDSVSADEAAGAGSAGSASPFDLSSGVDGGWVVVLFVSAIALASAGYVAGRLSTLRTKQPDSQDILDHLSEAVACFDQHEKLTQYNRALQQLLTCDEHFLPSAPTFSELAARIVELLSVDSNDATRIWWEMSALGNITDDIPHELLLQNDRTFLVQKNRTANNGRVLLFFDITTLSQKSIALEQSNRDLEQFAYIASHDLQEPLRMVASFTQLLQQRYNNQLDDQGREYIRYAVEGSHRMQALLEELLFFSKVHSHVRDLKPVSLVTACEDACKNLSGIIRNSRAIIDFDFLPDVIGNHVQLTQVFQNLISNAIKFNDGRPYIAITAQQRQNYWVIQVSDNGIGMPDEHIEKIFKIFQRLHNAPDEKGNGIGLALCKKVVEHHKGRIWVDSEVGRGTIFTFTLPSALLLDRVANDDTIEAVKVENDEIANA